MANFTVAIPSYNGENRLPKLLDRLRGQVNLENITWEVIVVDNNSTDNTAQVIRNYQTNWLPNCSLKYYFAPEQGAAFARQKAAQKAQGELIGFLDDDNLPAFDWVAQAYQFGSNNPQVGAFGSQIHGDFFEQPDGKLPEDFQPLASFLAIIERGDQACLYERRHRILPPGAGLVVRRDAWLNHVPQRLKLNHKGKDAGLASEDLEVLIHIQQAGWEIWYNPAMVIYHRIPNSRLQRDYLLKLVRCIGLSRHRLRMMTLRHWQKAIFFPVYLANDLRRLALHQIKHGKQIRTDLPAACKQELLVSTLASPFFLWKNWRSIEQQTPNLAESQCLEEIAIAFEQEHFRLHSQKIQPLQDSLLPENYSEVLLRLEARPDKLRLPKEFMPIAERYHLMRTLDYWVIRQLCAQIAQLDKQQRLSVYEINLSCATIEDSQLINFLTTVLQDYDVAPQMLRFSIRESIVISNFEQVATLSVELKNLGFSVTVDNVSSLVNNIQAWEVLTVDYLKFNSKLISSLSREYSVREQLATVNQEIQQKGIKTVAEFVEDINILEQMKNLGINYAQGYSIASTTPLIFADSMQLHSDKTSILTS